MLLIAIIFMGIGFSIMLVVFVINDYITLSKYQITIKEKCGHIFNPSLSISNYTSYQHCIKYPDNYGVKS